MAILYWLMGGVIILAQFIWWLGSLLQIKKKEGENMTAILKGILKELMAKISPEIRAQLKIFMEQWKAKAAATDNWYDDLLVDFLYDILGFNEG